MKSEIKLYALPINAENFPKPDDLVTFGFMIGHRSYTGELMNFQGGFILKSNTGDIVEIKIDRSYNARF